MVNFYGRDGGEMEWLVGSFCRFVGLEERVERSFGGVSRNIGFFSWFGKDLRIIFFI